MIARCGDMTDRLMMDQPGAVVRTRGYNYRCRGNMRQGRRGGMQWDRCDMMMSFWMRWALVGRQGVVVVWEVIKGDGEGLVGSGWWVGR